LVIWIGPFNIVKDNQENYYVSRIKMKVLILAGGFATRLWPLSEKRTKPLLYVAGKPIISHMVGKIPQDLEIVISTNEQFQKHFETWQKKCFPERNIKILVEPSKSEKEKKGAIAAIDYAVQENHIDDDLLVLAGDNLFTFDLKDFIGKFKGNALVALYDIQDKEAAKKFGVVESKDGKIIGFEEKPEEPKSTTVSTLCYVLPKESLGYLKEFAKTGKDNAGDFIAYLIEDTPFDVDPYVFSGHWFDIGSFEAYIDANKKLHSEPIISQEASISSDSKITGSSFIAEDVEINNSIIENSVIMENSKIYNSTLRNCVVDDNSSIKNATLENQLIRNKSII